MERAKKALEIERGQRNQARKKLQQLRKRESQLKSQLEGYISVPDSIREKDIDRIRGFREQKQRKLRSELSKVQRQKFKQRKRFERQAEEVGESVDFVQQQQQRLQAQQARARGRRSPEDARARSNLTERKLELKRKARREGQTGQELKETDRNIDTPGRTGGFGEELDGINPLTGARIGEDIKTRSGEVISEREFIRRQTKRGRELQRARTEGRLGVRPVTRTGTSGGLFLQATSRDSFERVIRETEKERRDAQTSKNIKEDLFKRTDGRRTQDLADVTGTRQGSGSVDGSDIIVGVSDRSGDVSVQRDIFTRVGLKNVLFGTDRSGVRGGPVDRSDRVAGSVDISDRQDQGFFETLREEGRQETQREGVIGAGPDTAFSGLLLGIGSSLEKLKETVVDPVAGFGKRLVTEPVETSREVGSTISDVAETTTEKTVKFTASLSADPVGTIKKAGQTAGGAALVFGKGIKKSFERDPLFATGEIVGDTVAFEGGVRLLEKGKDIVTFVTAAERRTPDEVFSAKALSGEEKFPTTGSVDESIQKFRATRNEEGDIIVVTASPTKLKGTQAGAGPKAEANLEDPGIFVTPKGEAVPVFLGTSGEGGVTLTLNPFKRVKEAFRTPTVTEFQAKDVKRIPPSVAREPGFEEVRRFFKEEAAGTGDVFITKRSQIGQGEIPRQKLETTAPAELGGTKIPKGQTRTEAGTSELEAIIPEGQTFTKIKGPKIITIFEGKPVRIRQAELDIKAADDLATSTKTTVQETTIKESGDLSRISSQKEEITPLFSSPPSTTNQTSTSTISEPATTTETTQTSEEKVEEEDILEESTSTSTSESVELLSDVSVSDADRLVSEGSNVSRKTSRKQESTSRSTSSRQSSTSRVPERAREVLSSRAISRASRSPSVTRRGTSRSVTGLGSSVAGGGRRTTPGTTRSRLLFDQPDIERVNVQIRRGGKFFDIGQGLPADLALQRGVQAVRGTAAASFRFTDEGGRVLSPEELDVSVPEEFKPSKTEKNVLVEENVFRIDAPGELQEITLEGIRASRGKRKKSRKKRDPLGFDDLFKDEGVKGVKGFDDISLPKI